MTSVILKPVEYTKPRFSPYCIPNELLYGIDQHWAAHTNSGQFVSWVTAVCLFLHGSLLSRCVIPIDKSEAVSMGITGSI